MNPLVVGELNPYGTNGKYALYPYPENSAGGRLCRLILRMRPGAYVAAYRRENLCTEKWSLPTARLNAATLQRTLRGAPLVLLGAKVCAAFGVPFIPFTASTTVDGPLVVLPHPSGLNRLWNDPMAYVRARDALRSAGCPLGASTEEG